LIWLENATSTSGDNQEEISLWKDGVKNSGEEKLLKPKILIHPQPHTLTKRELFHKREILSLILLVWLATKIASLMGVATLG
jgi:hypothetical protein